MGRWQRFLSPQEVAADILEPGLTVCAPRFWYSYEVNGQNLPGLGYGTYTLALIGTWRELV